MEYLLYFQKCKGEKIVFSFESSIKIGVFSCVQILKYIFDLGQLHMRRPKQEFFKVKYEWMNRQCKIQNVTSREIDLVHKLKVAT